MDFLKKQLLFNETLERRTIYCCLQNKPHNAKKLSIIYKKKSGKSVKQSKTVTYPLNNFQKSNIVDIKSIITEHPKVSLKLFKTIRQTEK